MASPKEYLDFVMELPYDDAKEMILVDHVEVVQRR